MTSGVDEQGLSTDADNTGEMTPRIEFEEDAGCTVSVGSVSVSMSMSVASLTSGRGQRGMGNL